MKTEAELLLCLQFSPHDYGEALELAQLICDIEPVKRSDVDFMISTRRDVTDQQRQAIVNILLTKFNRVLQHRNTRFGKGWPHGCNELWFDTMTYASIFKQDGRTTATGILTFEADCVPLREDWICVLKEEWSIARAEGKRVIGHAQDHKGEGAPTHINGNALFDIDLINDLPHGCSARTAWDVALGEQILKIAIDTFAIFQLYRITDVKEDQFIGFRKQDQVPALFHGIKDNSGRRWARKNLVEKVVEV